MRFLIIAAVAGVVVSTAAAGASGTVLLSGAPKPVFLYAGAKNDFGWNQSVDLARRKLQSALHMTIPYAEATNGADVKSVTEKFIHQGNNVVVGDAAEYSVPFKDLAEKYAHVVFIDLADDIVGAPKAPNLRTVYGRSYESQYLCGVVAGMTSKKGNIGFLAPRDSPIFNWEINGYTLGARRANPVATVHVVFTGDSSPAKEREAASALIDRGADVLGQSVDGPTPQVVAQERGLFATGYAVDLHELAPKSALCASIWVWDRYLSPEIAQIAAGHWQAEPSSLLSITEGGPDVACCSNAITHETMIKLLTERDGIIIDRNQVFAGPILDNRNKQRAPPGGVLSDAQLWAMDWYVQGVVIDR